MGTMSIKNIPKTKLYFYEKVIFKPIYYGTNDGKCCIM